MDGVCVRLCRARGGGGTASQQPQTKGAAQGVLQLLGNGAHEVSGTLSKTNPCGTLGG